MTFKKIIKFRDKSGKWHSYLATIIDGVLSKEDLENINKIKGSQF